MIFPNKIVHFGRPQTNFSGFKKWKKKKKKNQNKTKNKTKQKKTNKQKQKQKKTKKKKKKKNWCILWQFEPTSRSDFFVN